MFNVQLLIYCSLYIDCCALVAGNPWLCDCDRMYSVYRGLREGRGQRVTLWCENPAELRGKSWDVLEDRCKPTVTPPQPAVTVNTTDVSTSQPVQFNTTNRQNVSVQETPVDASHSPSTFLLIFVVCFTAAVFMAVVVILIIIRSFRPHSLNLLRVEDVVSRQKPMSKCIYSRRLRRPSEETTSL